MIYWVKFEGKLFFDPECTGPLLQTLPLNSSSFPRDRYEKNGSVIVTTDKLEIKSFQLHFVYVSCLYIRFFLALNKKT